MSWIALNKAGLCRGEGGLRRGEGGDGAAASCPTSTVTLSHLLSLSGPLLPCRLSTGTGPNCYSECFPKVPDASQSPCPKLTLVSSQTVPAPALVQRMPLPPEAVRRMWVLVLMPPLLYQHRGCHGSPCPRQNRESSRWWPVRTCVPTEPTLMENSPPHLSSPPQPCAFPHSLSVIVLLPVLSVIGLSCPSFPFFLEPSGPVFLSSLQSTESVGAAHLLLSVLLSRSSLQDPSSPHLSRQTRVSLLPALSPQCPQGCVGVTVLLEVDTGCGR